MRTFLNTSTALKRRHIKLDPVRGNIIGRNMMEPDACEGIDAFPQKRGHDWQTKA